jgi:DNA-binding NarL/FixJ family response regulator
MPANVSNIQPSAIVSQEQHLGQMRFLLVDDHAIVRVGLKQTLADSFERLEVMEAGTGQEAIQKIQDSAWDLVVLDINLPDTNGLDVLKRLKAIRPSLPIEVLSMIGSGKSVTEIAAGLDLSVKTVSTYRMRLLSKLQLKTTSALIRYALTHQL